MKKWIKASLGSSLLIVAILIVLALAYSGFIAGPRRAYEREDRYVVEAMMKAKGYKQAQLLNRFSYDKVYYITEVTHKGSKFIVWFTKDLSRVVKEDAVDMQAMDSILESLALTKDNLNLGIYNNELVYVVKTKNYEAFYALETLEKVFEFGGNS